MANNYRFFLSRYFFSRITAHLRQYLHPLSIILVLVTSNSWPRKQCVLFFCNLVARPFIAISSILSLCVPRNRCFGFTQGGLSHLCKTQSLSFILPWNNNHENLWARHILFLNLNHPYPDRLSTEAVQIQQSSDLSIFDINLFMVGASNG